MLKKWLKKRRDIAEDEQFRNGWCWAMRSYYLDEMKCKEINAYTHCSSSSFDRGANAAVRLIKS